MGGLGLSAKSSLVGGFTGRTMSDFFVLHMYASLVGGFASPPALKHSYTRGAQTVIIKRGSKVRFGTCEAA